MEADVEVEKIEAWKSTASASLDSGGDGSGMKIDRFCMSLLLSQLQALHSTYTYLYDY